MCHERTFPPLGTGKQRLTAKSPNSTFLEYRRDLAERLERLHVPGSFCLTLLRSKTQRLRRLGLGSASCPLLCANSGRRKHHHQGQWQYGRHQHSKLAILHHGLASSIMESCLRDWELEAEAIMVVAVRLQGGLGNQLFQYAAARQLAHLRASDLVLDIAPLVAPVIHARGGELQRQFELGALRTKGTISCLRSWPPAARLRVRVAGRLAPGMARWLGVFREPHFHFAPSFFALPSEIYLIGSFQSERYFAGVSEEIREELQPREDRLHQEAQMEIARLHRAGRPLVSVHLRRADYVTKQALTGRFYRLDSEYYASAMARFGPSADYLLFSDDVAWCRDNMRGDNIFYCSTGRALDDLLRMTLCDHHIIANSTFSWWAAWLDHKVNKIVVAPRRWFGPAAQQLNTADLLPSSWIVV